MDHRDNLVRSLRAQNEMMFGRNHSVLQSPLLQFQLAVFDEQNGHTPKAEENRCMLRRPSVQQHSRKKVWGNKKGDDINQYGKYQRSQTG